MRSLSWMLVQGVGVGRGGILAITLTASRSGGGACNYAGSVAAGASAAVSASSWPGDWP
jgi:hypothetical protein